jgi:hypothetical protein
MKLKTLFVGIAVMSLLACSSDDNDGGNQPGNNEFLPLSNNNFWVYEISSPQGIQQDSVYVNGDIIINNQTFKKMNAREPFFGFYAGAVHNNGIREDNGKLFMSGTFAGAGLGDFIDLNLELNNFVIFDENATANNQQLSVINGVLTEDFDGFPITVTYALKSFAQTQINNFEATNGQNYPVAKPVKIVLNIKVSTAIEVLPGFPPVNVNILNDQDLVVSTSYFVQNIGIVQTDTNYQFEINPQLANFPGFGDLPIPENGSSTLNEKLINFNVNN